MEKVCPMWPTLGSRTPKEQNRACRVLLPDSIVSVLNDSLSCEIISKYVSK